MAIKIGVSGFGRISRVVIRAAMDMPEIEIAGINVRNADKEYMVYMLKYDTVFGRFPKELGVHDDGIIIDGKKVPVYSESDAANIPWDKCGAEYIVEGTGAYNTTEKAMVHINKGAKKVIITAPAKDEDITVVLGVNEKDYDNEKHNIISNASCTTNCLAPFAKVLDEKFGIEEGLMTTIHAYTNDQQLLDKTHKDLRRARAAAESMIPTTTGAAKAVAKVLPQLEGKLNGFSVRVPTPTVSLVDLVCTLKKGATIEEVNSALKEASEGELKGILGYCDLPLVSIDFRGDSRSSIIDALSTMAIGDKMFKVVSWYDNEWGYSTRTVDLVKYVAERL